jgi:hypothetical protein
MGKGFSLRSLMVTAVAGLGFGVPAVAHAACSGGPTLSGYYGMQVAGRTPGGNGKFLNGTVYFNGACALQALATIGENGSVNSFVTWLGTYGTNADGTITLSFTLPGGAAPETYDVAFSPVLNEALGTETDSSAVASIEIKAQGAPASVNHYSNASLKGTFASSCSGTNLAYGEVSLLTFDGSNSSGGYGNITGVNHSNDAFTFSAASVTGFYGVGQSGAFGGEVLLNGVPFAGFSGTIDNNLNEIQFTLSTAGSTGMDVEACIGKRVS